MSQELDRRYEKALEVLRHAKEAIHREGWEDGPTFEQVESEIDDLLREANEDAEMEKIDAAELAKIPLKEKVETVLAKCYGGLHNVPGKVKDCGHYLEVTVPTNQLSTFDSSQLTWLVLGAHDQAVRISLRNAGPRNLVLMFHDRSRKGAWHSRHHDIFEAIAIYHK